MNDNMFTDMMSEIKSTSKRYFILIIILIAVAFLSNLAWLYVTSLPTEERTESYELEGSEDANVFYNSQGDVKINSEDK